MLHETSVIGFVCLESTSSCYLGLPSTLLDEAPWSCYLKTHHGFEQHQPHWSIGWWEAGYKGAQFKGQTSSWLCRSLWEETMAWNFCFEGFPAPSHKILNAFTVFGVSKAGPPWRPLIFFLFCGYLGIRGGYCIAGIPMTCSQIPGAIQLWPFTSCNGIVHFINGVRAISTYNL